MNAFTRSLRQPILFLATLLLLASALLLLLAGRASHPTARPSSDAVSAAMPNLEGEKATEYLQQNGLHASLGAAMAEARYRVWPDPQQPGSFYANNAAQRLSTSFHQDGVELRVKQGEQTERLSLRLQSIGYGVRQTPVETGTLHTQGNRVEYIHPLPAANGNASVVLTEWYVNTTAGLEQGFTLNERPDANGDAEALRLGLTMQGKWQAQPSADGQAIVWNDQQGREALRYDKLKVTDADGHEIPARMTVAAQQLWLEVQEADARYPLTIDPLFTQTQKLTASDGATIDGFGSAVAISGDTAIVGAGGDDVGSNADQGSAYIFERNQGGANNWGQVQKLIASDGVTDEGSGFSVAISGDAAIVGTPNGDVGSNVNQGAAYIFERNTGGANNWGQVQKLTASDGAAGEQFGHSVSLSSGTAIVGALSDNVGSNVDQGSAYIFTINCPPVITPQTVTRQQGSTATNSVIATVTDDLTTAGSVTVVLNGALPAGINVTNLVNTNGTITADVSAACSVAPGDYAVGLKATDGDGLMTTTSVRVQVTANTGPTLTYPANPGTSYGTGLTINPLTGSSGGVTSVNVQSIMPMNPGGITVNSAGVVTVASSVPAGTYTVTIRANAACGHTDASFTLGIVRAPLTVM